MIWACRLDESKEQEVDYRGLFKVSLFQFAEKHTFGVILGDAEVERARWVGAIACSIRMFTKALFPSFKMAIDPIKRAPWTSNRLLAGYVLLCLSNSVVLVYAELH